MFVTKIFGKCHIITLWTFIHILYANNIVYVDNEKTWFEAQTYCESIGGNLINLKELKETKRFGDKIKNEEFWIGELTNLSSWMNILGCYESLQRLNLGSEVCQHILTEKNPAACEQICQGYNLFGLMGKKCLCVKNRTQLNSTLIRNLKATANSCNTPCDGFYPTGACGGLSHYTFYNRVNINIKKHDNSRSCEICRCVAAECRSETKVELFRANCSTPFRAACRVNYNTSGSSWFEGFRNCHQRKDYLVGQTNSCRRLTSGPSWLSIFRDVVTLNVNELHSLTERTYTNTSCSSASFDGSMYDMENTCTEDKKPFFCEIVSSDNGETDCDSPSTETQPSTSTGTIIGAVIASLVIAAAAAVILVLICRYRKKLTSKSDQNRQYLESSKSPNKIQGVTNNRFMYDSTKPISDLPMSQMNHDSGYEFASIPSQAKNGHLSEPKIDSDMPKRNQDTGYEFAQIPNRKESDYVYTDTVDGDYDLLHGKDDRKVNKTTAEDTNCYAHTGQGTADDETYDTTKSNEYKDEESDTYDHAKLTKLTTIDDPYDHTSI